METSSPAAQKPKKPMLHYIEISSPVAAEYLNQPLDDRSQQFIERALSNPAIVFTGCGTSYHLALWAARCFRRFAKVDTYAIPSADLEYYQPEIVAGKILFAISHSGATKATLEAMAKVKQYQPACTVGLSFADSTHMALAADLHLSFPGGFEEALPKSMTFTSGALQLLRLALGINAAGGNCQPRLDGSFGKTMQQALDKNRRLIDQAAAGWAAFEDFYFSGGGPAWITAIEIALKMRENNYTCSQGLEIEEISHGTVPCFGPGKPVILIALPGPALQCTREILSAAAYVGSPTLVVAAQGVELPVQPTYLVDIPQSECEELGAVLAALPLQYFSNQISVAKGIDPNSLRLEYPQYRQAETNWIFPPGTH